VDIDCRLHGMKNLFVADGSVFSTSAGLNPALTIQANAFRVADRIIELHKAGKL
jgi:choline dehydrogenase-like flavoprotein